MQHPTLTVQAVSMAARANLFCDLTPSLYTTNNIASKKKATFGAFFKYALMVPHLNHDDDD
jgi:hypothetical protein